ncbi:MAG: hypothetical protein KJ941_09735 [Bacteroidetes bacterium]|nr:hypothetical protein [Bacteroidota bacterium]
MKFNRVLKLELWAAVMCFVLLGSCTKEEAQPEATEKSEIAIKMQDGTWRITKYTRGDMDYTKSYASHKFYFYKSSYYKGVLESNVKEGRWGVSERKGVTDPTKELFDLYLYTNENNVYSELDRKWNINYYSTFKIDLSFLDTKTNEEFFLTLEKN